MRPNDDDDEELSIVVAKLWKFQVDNRDDGYVAHLASCPKCRSLAIWIDRESRPGHGVACDPPRHWIIAFWGALPEADFWSFCDQDFAGSGDGCAHRCGRLWRGRNVGPSPN